MAWSTVSEYIYQSGHLDFPPVLLQQRERDRERRARGWGRGDPQSLAKLRVCLNEPITRITKTPLSNEGWTDLRRARSDKTPRHATDPGAGLAAPSVRCTTPQMLCWGPSRSLTLATLGIRCFPAAVEAAMSAAAELVQPRPTPESHKSIPRTGPHQRAGPQQTRSRNRKRNSPGRPLTVAWVGRDVTSFP